MASPVRYVTDLTDERWALIERRLPAPPTGPNGGRPLQRPRREVDNASLYVIWGRLRLAAAAPGATGSGRAEGPSRRPWAPAPVPRPAGGWISQRAVGDVARR
jgi:transposase